MRISLRWEIKKDSSMRYLGDLPITLPIDQVSTCVLRAKNLLEESAEMYDENVVVSVAPSVTRWTAHERAFKSVIKG